MGKLLNLHICIILVLLISACDNPTTSEPTNERPASVSTEVTAPTQVKIATPTPYSAIEDSNLGENEEGKGLVPGEHVEEITIADIHGNPYPIRQAWSEKPALIIFYRGGWCPYCNAQIRELSVKYPLLEAAGVQPVLISVDEPDKAALMDAQYEIPFPVLSDPKLIAHEAFNVVLELDTETLARYKEYGIDLSAWSGQQHNKIAVSSTFLVDRKGHVLFSHALKDYRKRPSVEQLVEIINELGKE